MDDEDYEMTEQGAKDYLARKGKPVTKENIDKCRKGGKIYGDPVAEITW
jgi:hypothetical protein